MAAKPQPPKSTVEERFPFGANWARFLQGLSEERIIEAERSLIEALGSSSLAGRRFLDVGSGSGLFSLAARRLGADVHSFDYDRQSVECTTELRRRYYNHDPDWQVEQGSVLDQDYLETLGTFDVVYAWGVLHHTGAMWPAMANVTALVASGGRLFIAIYNDQGRKSRIWSKIKLLYNRLPSPLQPIFAAAFLCRFWGPTVARDLVHGRPGTSWNAYVRSRGMSPWTDVIDWVGGYPFEVARPDAIFHFFAERGFALEWLRTCQGGLGNNQFVFRRGPESDS